MNAVLLATLVAAVVGVGHWLAHRVFGDEVYFSKSGVSKAGVVVTGLAWFGTYIAAGGGALLAPVVALVEALIQLVVVVIEGVAQIAAGGMP